MNSTSRRSLLDSRARVGAAPESAPGAARLPAVPHARRLPAVRPHERLERTRACGARARAPLSRRLERKAAGRAGLRRGRATGKRPAALVPAAAARANDGCDELLG